MTWESIAANVTYVNTYMTTAGVVEFAMPDKADPRKHTNKIARDRSCDFVDRSSPAEECTQTELALAQQG
jgi:hypothetical protein